METEDNVSKILTPGRPYICRDHDKFYETPSECFDLNVNIKSAYIDIPRREIQSKHNNKFKDGQGRSYSLHKGILVLDKGQKDGSNIITDIGNRDLERILEKKGFESLGRADNLRKGMEAL